MRHLKIQTGDMSSFYSEEINSKNVESHWELAEKYQSQGTGNYKKKNSDKNSENTFMYHKMYCVGKKRGEKKHWMLFCEETPGFDCLLPLLLYSIFSKLFQ